MKTKPTRATTDEIKVRSKSNSARVAGTTTPLGTRAEFLRTINSLANVPSRNGSEHDISDHQSSGVWTTFVSCPYEVWEQFFGEPEDVVQYESDSTARALQMWQHRCSDGTVECIGYLFARPGHGQWVIVARVCFR